jgi:hypothetical protein
VNAQNGSFEESRMFGLGHALQVFRGLKRIGSGLITASTQWTGRLLPRSCSSEMRASVDAEFIEQLMATNEHRHPPPYPADSSSASASTLEAK